MASAGEDRSIMLWDIASGKRIKKLTGHTGFIYSLSFSADSGVLVSGGADSTVCVWDVNTENTSAMASYMDTETNDAKRARLDEDKKRKAVHERLVYQKAVWPPNAKFFCLIVVSVLLYSQLNKHPFIILDSQTVIYVLLLVHSLHRKQPSISFSNLSIKSS